MNGNTMISKSKTKFNVLLVPYKGGSQGCKLLSQLSGIKRTKKGHVPNAKYTYLQWGTPCNKLAQYKLFTEHAIPCPEWTTEETTAKS